MCLCVCMAFEEFADVTFYISFDDPPILHKVLLLLPQVYASQQGGLCQGLSMNHAFACEIPVDVSLAFAYFHSHVIIVITCFSSCSGTRQVKC